MQHDEQANELHNEQEDAINRVPTSPIEMMQSSRLSGKRDTVKSAVIRVEQLTKNYYLGRNVVPALRGVNLEVKQGEFVALMGPSGSGKSTFMNLLGCLDRPTSGTYLLDGVAVSKMNANALADIRNQKIGFVFQSFNLLSWMTALDNVELPLVYSGVPRAERLRRAQLALAIVGLKARAAHRPTELSGGQQQRVAIARALVTSPSLFLADEPTGNLDSQTSTQIIAILQELNARGLTVVLVTHEPDIADCAKRQVKFRDGRVIDDTDVSAPIIVREDHAVGTRFIASAPSTSVGGNMDTMGADAINRVPTEEERSQEFPQSSGRQVAL